MSWWEKSKIGDKVVCVTKGFRRPPNWSVELYEFLIIGKIYTIRGLFPSNKGNDDMFFLTFDEMPGIDQIDARGFQPVQKTTTKTGMAILEKIRQGVKQPATIQVRKIKCQIKPKWIKIKT